MLLGSDDGAWSANSDPSNDFSMCKPVVFHDITGYQCPSSSQTSFAVDRDGPLRVLTDVEEPPHDVVAGGAAIYEKQVVVLEAGVGKAFRLVNLLVQSHDRSHVVLFEIRKIGFGRVERVTIFNFAFRMRSTKG